MKIDPITLEVLGNRFDAIAREIQTTLLRSSYSVILKEGEDCSAALFDAEGAIVAQSTGASHESTPSYPVQPPVEHPRPLLEPESSCLESCYQPPRFRIGMKANLFARRALGGIGLLRRSTIITRQNCEPYEGIHSRRGSVC